MSKAIISVLTDNKLKEKLVNNGYITAQNHSSKEFGDKLEKLYMQVIEGYKLKKEHPENKKSITKKMFDLFKL